MDHINGCHVFLKWISHVKSNGDSLFSRKLWLDYCPRIQCRWIWIHAYYRKLVDMMSVPRKESKAQMKWNHTTFVESFMEKITQTKPKPSELHWNWSESKFWFTFWRFDIYFSETHPVFHQIYHFHRFRGWSINRSMFGILRWTKFIFRNRNEIIVRICQNFGCENLFVVPFVWTVFSLSNGEQHGCWLARP